MLPSGLLLEQAPIVWLHDALILAPGDPYPLLTFSELRESDLYPKVNTPFSCYRRMLVMSHRFFVRTVREDP
jgi:hypothetical protein